MQLPAAFVQTITNSFGQKGEAWLAGLDTTVSQCIALWGLTDLTLAPKLSYNLICFARSQPFGDVVLKVGVPHPELTTEMRALELYGGRHICACHATSPQLGALLLERVTPGVDLTTVANSEERIRIAAELMDRLPVPAPAEHGLPAYTDWVAKAFRRAREEGFVPALLNEAEALVAALVAEGRPQVLLHGDLHHWNILQNRAGRWRAIDPKGAVSMQCLEPARFMQNELCLLNEAEWQVGLDAMTSAFGGALGESRRTMAACAFVDRVLSACWEVEDNVTPEQISRATAQCEYLLAYVRSL